MIEPNQASRPRWCPRCLNRMRILTNPYYGVGLAVATRWFAVHR
jgi:hypothetical protein